LITYFLALIVSCIFLINVVVTILIFCDQAWFAASDLGWVVGHSYIAYAPLLHCNTTILYEVSNCRRIYTSILLFVPLHCIFCYAFCLSLI